MGCKIVGCGKALPEFVVTNDDMSNIVDTSDEWIVERTGIHERRVALHETATDLAAAAARRALGWDAGGWQDGSLAGAIPADSIDLLVCATLSGDTIIPSQAALIRDRLGLPNAVAFDLNAACAGCTYAIDTATQFLELSAASATLPHAAKRNPIRRVLVVGTERLTRYVDWTDRATCVLFGDGAGAVLIDWVENESGIQATFLKNTDDVDMTLYLANTFDLTTFPFGKPFDAKGALSCVVATAPHVEQLSEIARALPSESIAQPDAFMHMQGQAVFKFAAAAMTEAVHVVCERAGITPNDIDYIVPHQANERIIKYAAKKLNLPMERFQVSIGETGNTSAAGALMALSDAYLQGHIHSGDTVVLVAFGGGLTAGAILFKA